MFDYIKNRDTYIEFKSGNNDISVIKFQEASDSIILLQLAKRKSIGLTSKGESTFVDKKQDDYPWAIVIFDYKNQTLYVERAYKVYALPNEMIALLKKAGVKMSSTDEMFLNASEEEKQEFLKFLESKRSRKNETLNLSEALEAENKDQLPYEEDDDYGRDISIWHTYTTCHN